MMSNRKDELALVYNTVEEGGESWRIGVSDLRKQISLSQRTRDIPFFLHETDFISSIILTVMVPVVYETSQEAVGNARP